MSNFDVVTKKRLDSRLNVSPENKEFIVDIAGAQVTQRREPATSYSSSIINFNITPNSPSSVVDRGIIVEVKLKYNFTRTAGPLSNILRPSRFGPRGFNYGVQSSNIIINGLSISQETQDIVHAQSHFNDAENIVRGQTISPTWFSPDYCQRYSDLSPGSNMNTLSDYENSTRSRFGKGSYHMEITNNTPTAAEVIVTFFEYLTLSPATYDGQLLPGLSNVTSLQLSFVLANLHRTFAVSSDLDSDYVGFTSSVVLEGVPQCHYQELSMPVYIESPPVVTMSYTDIQRQETTGPVIQPNTSVEVSSNSYQLNTVPHSIIVYAKESKSSINASPRKRFDTPDAYGVIEKLQIQYNNQSAILSSASPVQLFQMSSRNGLDMTFDEFQGRTTIANSVSPDIRNLALCGSLVCLSFGRDISANDPTALPGVSINSNFQVRATVKNPTDAAISYNLEVLYVYDGIISIAPGSAYKYVSLMTRDETLNLEVVDDSDSEGGKVDFKGLLQKAKTGLKKALPYLKPIAKAATSSAFDVAQDFGKQYIGDKGAQMARDLAREVTGLGMSGGMYGGGLQGGALVSKSRMSRRV